MSEASPWKANTAMRWLLLFCTLKHLLVITII